MRADTQGRGGIVREDKSTQDSSEHSAPSGRRWNHADGEAPVLAVASTFTADAIEQPLRFWLEELDIRARVVLAPYGQLMQSLLDPHSLLSANGTGFNLLLVRVSDFIRNVSGDEFDFDDHRRQLQSNISDLLRAIKTLKKSSSATLFVVIPASASNLSPELRSLCNDSQSDLVRGLDKLTGVSMWVHEEILRQYSVPEYEDLRGDSIAHIPYTDEYFASIATIIVRRVSEITTPRPKVIAVDCDGTLWEGVCGEDGANGVSLTRKHLEFQAFLVRQFEAGVLLSLCSKNNLKDVEVVFQTRSDMLLKPEHLVAWDVSWEPKSRALQRLASELSLSMDSVVLIDDSEYECTEVRSHCPATLTLKFPGCEDSVDEFLHGLWIFDHSDSTAEAKSRTKLYREDRVRQLAANEGGQDLESFLAGLELEVQVSPMEQGHLERVVELIQRTNQFNFTTRRRRGAEVVEFLRGSGARVYVVHVKDRFGDYGLVGVMMSERSGQCLDIDTFLLSCRVLGRGVEERVIRLVAEAAAGEGVETLNITYDYTDRNRPAWEFIERSFADFRTTAGGGKREIYRVPIASAVNVHRSPVRASLAGSVSSVPNTETPYGHRLRKIIDCASRFPRASQLTQAIRRSSQRRRPEDVLYRAPSSVYEREVATAWSEVLGIDTLGACDPFFDLGGDSLKAVRIISRLAESAGLELGLVDFLEDPTIENIAAKLAFSPRAIPRIEQTPRVRYMPLSWAQERLWFLDQLGLVGSAYNVPVVLHLKGSLNIAALERAMTSLVHRHEALRTHFEVKDGVPYQIIEAPSDVDLRRLDLGDVSSADRDQLLWAHINQEQQHRFNLSTGPLIRPTLISLTPVEHVLIVLMHHIVSDGWSIGIVTQDLSTFYSAMVGTESHQLQELEVQYADFAVWQRTWMAGERLESQLKYWSEQLRDAPSQLELPTDRPRPAAESFRGGSVSFEIDTRVCQALKRIGQEQGTTPFVVFFAAYQILLARWSRQCDLVIGTPIAGRHTKQTEGIAGFFVNTLTLRSRISPTATFRELLAEANGTVMDAFAHQHVPFDAVVKELRPERNLSRQPIFQVVLAFQNFPKQELRLPGITWSRVQTREFTTHFDLTLYLHEAADGINGSFEFARDLFDETTIRRMAASFQFLLRGIVEQPDQTTAKLPLLSAQDQSAVLHLWNRTHMPFPTDGLVHEMVEAQVAVIPDAIAVEDGDCALTYSELHRRAAQLSVALMEHGVRLDSLVPVLIGRSTEMVVAALGVLRAGAGYLALDPELPPHRLRLILNEVRPSVVITNAANREKMGAYVDAGVVVLDIDSLPLSSATPLSESNCRVVPGALAYAIYTSGSTGRPKGVLIPHKGLRNLVGWHLKAFDLRRGTRSSQVASQMFDAAVWEIWPALASGGTLCICKSSSLLSRDEFAAWMNRQQIEVAFVPTPIAEQLIQLDPSAMRSLRTLLTGGDLLRQMPLHAHRYELVNNYGPTEATVVATSGSVEAGVGRPPTIGAPIGNTQTYVLDANLNPVPIGVNGELYIGGEGIARGYLMRPELTAELFVPDPFAADGSRMYRSGDSVRWRESGVLEFHGRVDSQVKVRGFRIELAEIETTLLEHPLVKQALVLAREDKPGDKRLVGYVVGNRDGGIDEGKESTTESLGSLIVNEWETLYEETYRLGEANFAPSFVGWNSSYTGDPIPVSEMQEWLDNTVSRIHALKPRRVLEIGCGVGLILQRIAPSCEVYVGTDFSGLAIARLGSWVRSRSDLRNVELKRRAATELADLAPGSFDTIIVNSVVQYFPDLSYLLAVINSAISLLSSDGKVFIGDVRNLLTLKEFHTAVQLARASASVPIAQLKGRAERALVQDKELVISPEFFRALPGNVDGISGVEVLVKRGESVNELTRHRYDVILRTNGLVRRTPVLQAHEWRVVEGLAGVESLVSPPKEATIRIVGVPDRRLWKEREAVRWLETRSETEDAGTLRSHLRTASQDGVDPEELYKLGDRYGVQVAVTPEQGGSVSVDFAPLGIEGVLELPSTALNLLSSYSNDPLESGFRQQLVPILREHLRQRLPEYMVPSAWVVLKELPLTPNGKIDRRALPIPQGRPEELGDYIAPRSPAEKALADIWTKLLPVDQVGVHDNFFELGGHSLLIVQMMDLLAGMGLHTNVRNVYQFPTLELLAQHLSAQVGQVDRAPPSLIPLGCEMITPALLPMLTLEQGHIETVVHSVDGGVQNIQDIYPLASLQKGIVFHHLLNEGKGDAYILSALLSGHVDKQSPNALIDALQNVVDRHDILRTAILWEGLPEPLQVVYRRAVLPVEELHLDLTSDPLPQLMAFMGPASQRMNLRKAPLVRLQVVRETLDGVWYALLHVHHSICDHESVYIILSEVTRYLDKRGDQLPAALPYRDHVARVLALDHAQGAEGYFRAKLGDLEHSTSPFGLLDVYGDGSQIERAVRPLDLGLSRRIRRHAGRLGVSAATLFHVGWALLLGRLTGRDDVTFGTVLLGRLQGGAGVQLVPGMFINTLPLRIRLQALSLEELVRRTQQDLGELLGFEQAPLVVAQRCSCLPGSLPLFNTVLNYRHSPGAILNELEAAGVKLIADRAASNYPILFSVDDHGDAFALEMDTNECLSPNRMIEHVLRAMESLVECLDTGAPQDPRALEVISLSERSLVQNFSVGRECQAIDRLVHELIEQIARDTPASTALLMDGESMTYGELNEEADRLAMDLSGYGAGPGVLVALCLERSFDLVVALVAVLKSGAAYLPLDPGHPPQRVIEAIEDAAPAMVLAGEDSRLHLQELCDFTAAKDNSRLLVGRTLRTSRPANERQLHPGLAYVIYTSGSTGKPKGVMVKHRGIANFIASMKETPGMVSSDCMVALTTVAFDIAVLELLLPLAVGARVVVASRNVATDPSALAALIERSGATIVQATPATWEMLINNGWAGAPNLKLLCGGEALSGELALRLLSRGRTVWNMYGPTETTVWSCVRQISAADGVEGTVVAIGPPIRNTRIYILDRYDRPTPIGVEGELCIAGAGVADGYWDRPALTAERFVPDPMVCGDLMYRTGDVGRWRSSGLIDYLGRNDFQIKLRGFRIELGEIEGRMRQCRAVDRAVAVVREDFPGERRIVAYISAKTDSILNCEEIRESLSAVLPTYMIPTAFVVVDNWPLTPNGKLDRKALPIPAASRTSRPDPPEGELEKRLAMIWRDILRRDAVGREENFFELGGHSLVATRLISRVFDELGVAVPVRTIFETPTVRSLAVRIQSYIRSEEARATGNLGDDEILERIQKLESELRAAG